MPAEGPLKHSGFPYAAAFTALTPAALLIATFLLPVAPGPAFMEKPALVALVLGMFGLPLIVLFYPVFILLLLGLAFAPSQAALKSAHLAAAFSFCLGAVLLIALYQPVMMLRRWALEAAAARAAPLILALERYHDGSGRYPETLSELRPNHLFMIPETGMMGAPLWGYSTEWRQRDWREMNGGKNPGFDLHAYCSLPMRWDTFHYWPGQDYPEEMYGGKVERMGRWAYVHE